MSAVASGLTSTVVNAVPTGVWRGLDAAHGVLARSKSGEGVKSGPIGLAVILVLCVAVYFLFKSMSKHMKKVREEFPVGAAQEPSGPGPEQSPAQPPASSDPADAAGPAAPGTPVPPADAPPPPRSETS